MKNKVLIILVAAVLGFIVGYLIFGKFMGSYINISALFDFSGGDLGKFGRSVGGIKTIQQKVFLFTGIGAVTGFIYTKVKKK